MSTRSILRTALGLAVLFSPAFAFGWASTVPNATHEKLAYKVLQHSSLSSYVAQFSAYGLNIDNICDYANSEGGPQGGWGFANDMSYLNWTLTDANVGYIIHGGCDAGMPVSHSPANEVYTNTTREAYFEAGVTATYNAPEISSLLTGTYAQKLDTFHSTVISIASDYKKSNSIWNSKYYRLYPWADQGMLAGMQLTQTMLMEYFAVKMPPSLMAGGGMGMISTNAVPEPSTLAMLASLALAGCVVLVRRMRRQ